MANDKQPVPIDLTLRQQYVVAQMNGLLSWYADQAVRNSPDFRNIIAQEAFLLADALIEFERKEKL